MPAALDERASLWSMVLCENVCLFDHKLLWVVRESSKTSRYVRISRLDFSMMTGRMRWRFKNGEMLIKWKRSIWLDFFFLFSLLPVRFVGPFFWLSTGTISTKWFLSFPIGPICVCVCVCVLVYFNQSARRARRQRRSVNKTSFTNVQFIPILNQRLYPPDRLPPGNNKTYEREKKKKRPSSSARRSSLTVWKKEKQKSKKKITTRAPVWQCVAASTLTLTRSHGSATPRLWTSNRISYWLGDRLFLL